MKRANIFLVVILLVVMAGCGGGKQSTDNLIIVDVTKSYLEKKLILQDFMDVEYIVLETNDDFITRGVVKDVGKEIILVTNPNNDGDIFIFDRTGKGIRKINRRGQGPEEYTRFTDIILDETNSEIFVVDYAAKKILVYDLSGNFKRSFKNIDTGYYLSVFNFDQDHLIGYKFTIANERPCHLIISKQDGSIIREINVPFKEIKTSFVIEGEMSASFPYRQTLPNHNNFVLVEISSDTVYNYLPNGTLSPIIVRTPSIHSMEPEVFLLPGMMTDRYYFIQALQKVFNFETGKGFTYSALAYDRQDNTIYSCILYNDDFSNKKLFINSPPVNHEIATWQSLEAYQLVEALKKGDLKGRLKEIAATLDEEDNPVIMLVKHKK